MTQIAATLFGDALPEGGTIGVAAPSGPYFQRSDVLRGVDWWESKGYRVKLAKGVWEQDDYNAGTPEERARDLTDMFADGEVDVVQCLWGGTGAMQLLPHVDFDIIRASPKPFVGFSDITALHVAIRQETGLATIHGPGLGSMFVKERTDFTRDSLLAFLRGTTTGEIPRDPDDPYVRAIVPGKVTAPLVGGNLFTLQHLLGTPWEFHLEGTIFFFEEVNEPPYKVEAMLWQLGAAGKLDHVVGVVIGELDGCLGDKEGPRTRSIEDVLERQLAPLGVPVLYKLPLGHGKHLATMPLGVIATLDADARRLTIDQPCLRSANVDNRE